MDCFLGIVAIVGLAIWLVGTNWAQNAQPAPRFRHLRRRRRCHRG